MSAPVRFPFLPITSRSGVTFLQPLLPLTLRRAGEEVIRVHGLLDTGSAVNVLPYSIGLRLGAVWEAQATHVTLTGNLASQDARALLAEAQVSGLPAVQLVFAWTQSDAIPLLLGQVNFFQEFDICFHRARLHFEVQPAARE